MVRFCSFVSVLCLDSDRLVPADSNSVFLDPSNVMDESLLLLHTLHGAFEVSVQKAHYAFDAESENSNHCDDALGYTILRTNLPICVLLPVFQILWAGNSGDILAS